MTTTLRRDSTPSISASTWGTTVVSTSLDTPLPRVRNRASISSKKTTTGRSSALTLRAWVKMARIWRSVSPTNLLSSSGPLMLRKAADGAPRPSERAREVATALAMRVLPVPGGPYRSRPLGADRP